MGGGGKSGGGQPIAGMIGQGQAQGGQSPAMQMWPMMAMPQSMMAYQPQPGSGGPIPTPNFGGAARTVNPGFGGRMGIGSPIDIRGVQKTILTDDDEDDSIVNRR